MELLILALLGSALVGVSFINDNEDVADSDEATDGQTEVDTSIFTGTAEADVVDDSTTLATDVEGMELYGGDDVVDVTNYFLTDLDAGEGDDSIDVDAYYATINGGEGDDTLIVNGGNAIYGDAGNDTIETTQSSVGDYPTTIADGGDGDDVLTARDTAFYNTMFTVNDSGVNMTGGEGADTFNVIYAADDVDPDALSGGEAYHNNLVAITDFDPSEDTLVVEVETSDADLERDVDAQMEQTDNGDGTYTSVITLTLTKEGMDDGVTELTVISNAPFTLDDIQLVGV